MEGKQGEECGEGKRQGTVVPIKKVIMCRERVFQTSVYPDCNQHSSPRKEYETQLHVILGSDF